jgi:hypothetical protein
MEKNNINLSKMSPLFVVNLLDHAFPGRSNNLVRQVTVVELVCINPTSQLKLKEKYWGYKTKVYNRWYNDHKFPAYTIFLPTLGARHYSCNRFKVVNEFDVTENDIRYPAV